VVEILGAKDEDLYNYGQIVRSTNGVYTIWDLKKKIGYTFYCEPKVNKFGHHVSYGVGVIVLFRTDRNEISIVKSYVDPTTLPKGVSPLISVPKLPQPPTPSGHSNNVSRSAQAKRVVRG
jgi:hypothetical protein